MSRQGKLLVAHPQLDSRPFRHSVVLITEDHSQGTVGIILNTPTRFSLGQIMESKGYTVRDDRVVYLGGPVNETALVMVHSDEWFSSNTMSVDRGIAISSDNFMMEKLSMGNTPQQWRIVLGVSGWAPGQLEQEIARGDWLECERTPDIAFATDGDKQWHRALELCSSQMINQYF